MPRLSDLAAYVRSKNAGPFWVTIDIFFDDAAAYERTRRAEALSPASVAARYGVAPEHVQVFALDHLQTLKISLPRATPQGGARERDMHAGQQYVALLDTPIA